ncbi:MAG: hypothetical protein M1834_002160 [Cirrosporium novae-zelandiae]|nr:MAG: hypothetical protein M1834_002160 [Cirrosporium novae-zelandiae]
MSSRPPPLSTGPTNLPSTSVLPGTTMAETISHSSTTSSTTFIPTPSDDTSSTCTTRFPWIRFYIPRPSSTLGVGTVPSVPSTWATVKVEATTCRTSNCIASADITPDYSPIIILPNSLPRKRWSGATVFRLPADQNVAKSKFEIPSTSIDELSTASSIAQSPDSESPSRYRLHIRQQPIAARACGYGERDRRVIDPPPIIQLFLSDFDPNSDEDLSLVQYQFNIVHCSLYSHPDNQPPADASQLHDSNTGRVTRRLMGSLVGSPLTGIDPDPASSPLSQYLLPSLGGDPSRVSNYVKTVPSTFYIFPDLSCRTQGVYCLHFKVVRAGVEMASKGGRSSMEAEVVSDPFVVFPAKDFPGMKPSSILTKGMKAMGAAVTLKKGKGGPVAKKTPGKRSAGEDPAEEDDEGAESIIEEEVKGEGSRSGSVVIAKKQRRSGSGAGAPRGMNPQRAWEI